MFAKKLLGQKTKQNARPGGGPTIAEVIAANDQPGKRSGSGLGAVGRKPSAAPTGSHFGHHKKRSPKAKKAAAWKNKKTKSTFVGAQQMMTDSGLATYFPSMDAFIPNTMNIYANAGGSPPPSGSPRTANVNMLIAPAGLEGSRQRDVGMGGYTHIIICDIQIEVHDQYQGNTTSQVNTGDILGIPAGVSNYWIAVMVQVVNLPSVGRKKLILADRRGTVGDFTKIV